MKKVPNNQSSGYKGDYRLPRANILRGRKNFERLFERDAQIIRNKYVDVRFKIVDDSSFGCLMAFIVKKSLGKAYRRNHIKRLLREAYRHHQHLLIDDPLQNAKWTFHGALMAKSTDLNYKEVEENVVALLEDVRDRLPIFFTGDS